MTRKAIDVSNYTSTPTPQQVACLIADGYDTAIVGASYGHVARQQLTAFSAGGMAIEAYAFVEFRDTWKGALDRALAAIDGLPVARLWLDCEEDPQGDVIKRIIDAYHYVVDRGYAIGIYTGGWWWKPNTADWQGMNFLPLWSAEYRDPGNLDPSLYGGWTSVAIWQYAGSVDTCNLNSDRNVILEDDMTPAQMQELKGYMDMKLIQMIGWINEQKFAKQGDVITTPGDK